MVYTCSPHYLGQFGPANHYLQQISLKWRISVITK